MPFIPQRRTLRDLALDMAFAPWRIQSAALLPGIVILFLIALGVVFFMFMGRGDRLSGEVVGIMIGLTLATSLGVMGMLSVAIAIQEWRGNAGSVWSFAFDPACTAIAEKFARSYLIGEQGDAYGSLDAKAREERSLENFERERRDLGLPGEAKEASVWAEEDVDREPFDETGALRRCMVAGLSIAMVEVGFELVDATTRHQVSFDVFLCSSGKEWQVADWRLVGQSSRPLDLTNRRES